MAAGSGKCAPNASRNRAAASASSMAQRGCGAPLHGALGIGIASSPQRINSALLCAAPAQRRAVI